MNALMRAGLPLLSALLLAGCLETHTLIRVNRDGSGTLEETVILSGSLLEMMRQMGVSPQETGGSGGLPDREELQEKARGIGPGVQLVSADPMETEVGSGYRAVYRFDDIGSIRVNQNPGGKAPSPGSQGEVTEYLTFSFTRGNPSRLVILAPRDPEADDAEAEEPETDESADPAALAEMLRRIYRDLKISIALEVQGSIMNTNARYRDGSRITLVEMDFGRLMEDEERFQMLVRAQPKTLEQTKELLNGVPGLRLEVQDPIEVRFR